jgi:hypothetical protein
MFERHERRPWRSLRMPETPRELQARLDRFRAAVAEKRARQARQGGEPRRELRLQRVVEQVRRVQQRRRLVRDRAGETRMPVPERRHSDTGDQVEEALSVAGEQRAALARLEHHGGALVDLQNVLRVECDRILCHRRQHFVYSRSPDLVIVVPGAPL